MTYHLCPQNGDSIAVPQLVFANLSRADESTIRVALYILSTGVTDPREIAHALGLKSVRTAENALRWWAGAGLLEADRAPQAPLAEPIERPQIDLSTLRDPMVSVLTTETQMYLGRTLNHKDMDRLVGLYLQEEFSVEVILLCAAHIATQDKHTVAALDRELREWRLAGVESGEDAERYLKLLQLRSQRESHVAELLHMPAKDLNLADRRCIRRWYEEMNFDDAMVAEAILQANGKEEVRYVNGILKSWHGRGLQTVAQVRGSGTLDAPESGSLRVDRAAPSGHDILKRNTGRLLRLKRED